MFVYLLKSILCLLVLWGFYKLVLEPQAAHHFKRFYLLGSVLLAVVLPLITLTYTVEAVPSLPSQITQLPATFPIMDTPSTTDSETVDWLPILLGCLYSLGVLIFGYRFVRNLHLLYQKVRNNEQVKTSLHIAVLVRGKTVPHSFLHYIFLPKKAYKQDKIAPEILAHEQAHVSQKHSWDILLIEFLQVVFWFNPILVLVKKNMALNHEFLADQAALQQNYNIKAYTDLLFTYSDVAHHNTLTSQINYSLTRPPFQRAKKRILMLSQSFSAKKMATRLTFFLPILAFCVYFFSQGIVAQPVYSDQNITTTKDQPSKINGQPKNSSLSLQSNKRIDIFELKKKNLFINGKPIEIEKLDAELKLLYGEYSKEQLANQVVVNLQVYYPGADQVRVSAIAAALHKIGIKQFIKSAREFSNRREIPKNSSAISTVSGIPPKGLPSVHSNPEAYIDKMEEMNTTFFYNGQKISAERAKIVLNKNVRTYINFSSSYGEDPFMQLED